MFQEMEEFVQSSGEDGVVVFSLGSMVKNLTEEKANLIASALAQIPQKVSTLSVPAKKLCTNYGEMGPNHTLSWENLNSLHREYN